MVLALPLLWLISQASLVLGALLAALPWLLVRWREAQRRARRAWALDRDLPRLLELLVLHLEAGRSVEEGLAELARFGPPSYRQELRRYLALRELGEPRGPALERLLTEETAHGWRLALATLLQVEELGTPLASALAEISAAMEQRQQARLRGRAAQLSPRIALVTVFLGAPSAFLLFLGSLVLGGLGPLLRAGWMGP